MKLLVLTHRFPYPPTRGDCIRVWGELTQLAARHDVWLACVDRAMPRAEHLSRARRLCRDVAVAPRGHVRSLVRGVAGLVCGTSLTEAYTWDARLARTLERWVAAVGFDAVLTVSSAMAPYARLVSSAGRGRARCVLDMNDVDSEKWRRYAATSRSPLGWAYALEGRRLARLEERAVEQHDLCLLVNQRERGKLAARIPNGRLAISPTGVDLDSFGRASDTAPAAAGEERGPVVGMVGSMFYPPNVRAVTWFGRHVWPRLREAMPGLRWDIVGNRPVRSVRRWSRHGARVTGFVRDVRPYLAAMDVYVCAARDEIGVQTKLIEALAAGKAAVVTPEAAEGIDHDGPPPFRVAGTPEAFADCVIELLSDGEQRRELGQRARATAAAHYDVVHQVARVEQWLLGTDSADGDAKNASSDETAASGVGELDARTGALRGMVTV